MNSKTCLTLQSLRSIAFLLSLVVVLPCFAEKEFPTLASTALDLEIQYNPGLDYASLRRMGMATASRLGMQAQEAEALVHPMTEIQLRQYLLKEFPIEYLEVPVAELEQIGLWSQEKSKQMADPNIDFIIFQSGGISKARIFIHPLASGSQIETALKAAGKKAVRLSGRFRCRLTSSRSVWLLDRQSKRLASLKLSLLEATGQFKNKEYRHEEAQFHLAMSDTVIQNNREHRDRPVRLHPETAFTSFRTQDGSVNEAQILRSLDSIQQGRIPLTAAALLHNHFGIDVAKRNGSTNPIQFWRDHLILPLGELTARLEGDLQAQHSSLHSQNVIVEFDQNLKPLGVQIRDPDFDLHEASWSARPERAAALATAPSYRAKERLISFSLLNGLPDFPSWLQSEGYLYWINEFSEAFAKGWTKILGIHYVTGIAERQIGRGSSPLNTENIPMLWNPNGHYSINLSKLEESYRVGQAPPGLRAFAQFAANQPSRTDKSWSELVNLAPSLTPWKQNPKEALRVLLSDVESRMIRGVLGRARPLFALGFQIHYQEYLKDAKSGRTDSLLRKLLKSQNPEDHKKIAALMSLMTLEHEVFFLEFLSFVDLKQTPNVHEFLNNTSLAYSEKAFLKFISIASTEHLEALFNGAKSNRWHRSPTVARALLAKAPKESVELMKEKIELSRDSDKTESPYYRSEFLNELIHQRLNESSQTSRAQSVLRSCPQAHPLK